jgi:predicted nucleic acid-binding protein
MSIFPPNTFVIDACSLLNLYATGKFREIGVALGLKVLIVDYVISQEALYIKSEDLTGKHPLVLDSLIDNGILEVIQLASKEQEAFIDLATDLDDGEAMTIAVSISRGYGVITDDRKAIKTVQSYKGRIALLTTLQMVKSWGELTGEREPEIKKVLTRIRSLSNYVPGENHPLYAWWSRIMD